MMIDFCLPVFNEQEIIEQNIVKLFNYCKNSNFNFDWRIVIINNGSTDKTKEESLKLLSDKIIYFEVKLPGRGRALKEYWLSSKSDILVYMDIDMAVSFNYIPDLVSPIIDGRYDLVMGSRRLLTSKYQRSFVRDFSSKIYLFLFHKLLNYKYTDLQCGFKAIRNDKFKSLSKYLEDFYWFFDTELVVFTCIFNGRIKEIAINWQENRYKNRKSKVTIFQDGISSIINIFKLRKRIKKLNGAKIGE